jgi:hypothetical protein
MPSPADDPTFPVPNLPRRHLLAGLGALGGGAAIAGLPGAAAAADPDGAAGPPALDGPGGRATPITSTLASAPEAGVRYEFRGPFDFVVENPSAGLTWSSLGVYASGGESTIWTSFDLPPGAIVHDIEWYVYNASGAGTSGFGRAWTASSANLTSSIVDVAIPSASGVNRRRALAPASTQGPFPHGCRAFCGLPTRPDGEVRTNGVRIGYRPAAGAVALLPQAKRVYDSRSSTPFAPNETRTVSLAGAIPAGALGAVISLSITGCQHKGTLRLGAGGTVPSATAIQWARTGDQVTTAANSPIDGARRVAIKSVGSTGTTHVVVDVVGYVS